MRSNSIKKKFITLLLTLSFAFVSAFVSHAYYEDEYDFDEYDDEDYSYEDNNWEDDDWLTKGINKAVKIAGGYATQSGQPVSGWCRYQDTYDSIPVSAYEFQDIDYTIWIYGLPGTNGKLLTDSWILDNGKVYYLDLVGLTKHNSSVKFDETNNPERPDSIYNVQTNTFEVLPYKLTGNSHSILIPYSGAIDVDSFLYTLSGKRYEDWKTANQDWINSLTNPKAVLAAEDEETLWNTAAMYIPQAMAEAKPGVAYMVKGRSQIMSSVLGGHYVYFKVEVPSEHYTGSLKISILQDGRYHYASFD